MSSKKFWKLSFYEWSIWLARIKSKQDKRRQDMELLIELERNSMALFANANFKGTHTGQDFYKLSYDTPTDTEPSVEDKEQLAATIKKLEHKARKRLKRG